MKRKISLVVLLVLCFSFLMTAFSGAQETKIEVDEVTLKDFTASSNVKFDPTVTINPSYVNSTAAYELSEDGTYYTVTGFLGMGWLTVPATYNGIEVRYVNLSALKTGLVKITVPISVQVLDQDNIYTLEEANTIFDLDGTLSEDGATYIFDNANLVCKVETNINGGLTIIDSTTIETNYIYKGHDVFEIYGLYFIIDENGFTDVSEYRIFFINKNLPEVVINFLGFFVNILEPPYTWIINLF